MELRYCEECGDVIRLDSDEPPRLHEHFVCPKCKGEVPATHGGGEPARTLVQDFSVENLDLFSSQSIALRKQGTELAAPRAPDARLRLVKTTETSVTEAPLPAAPSFPANQPAAAPGARQPRPHAPPQPAPASPAAPGLVPKAQVAPGPAPKKPEAQPAATAADASGRPAKSARKIIFRCLYCKSPLSIRPVEKTSKLICPSCGEAVYVTPSGRLMKKNPSLAVRKGPGGGSHPGPQSVKASTLAYHGGGLRTSATPSDAAQHALEAVETRERLSAFEEHVFSQDPNKTAFLTEESSPLSDLGRGGVDDFPLANEFLSTAVRAPEEDEEPEEEWPGESDLLAEDEFDENLESGSRRRKRTRRPPTARAILVGAALLLPFALAVGLFVTHFSDPESRAFDPDPALSTLEKLGHAAQRGIITLFSDGEGPSGRWVPGR